MNIKRSLLVGATVSTIALGSGVGLVSAASDTSSSTTNSSSSDTKTSLIDKIASKFNLNKDDVAAVFTADRAEHQAAMQAQQKAALAQAVTDGKLTQAQADYITTALAEIQSMRADSTPDSQDSTSSDEIKAKMEALKTWATDNKIDSQYIMSGHGMGGPGGPRGAKPTDSTSSTSTTN